MWRRVVFSMSELAALSGANGAQSIDRRRSVLFLALALRTTETDRCLRYDCSRLVGVVE
jgi:hypothetical protein